MIESAQEFIRLRTSENPDEYLRAAHDEAPDAVWRELVAGYPEMRQWVAHNKTVPVAILELLHADSSAYVRMTVARKRKLPEHLQHALAADSDASVRHALACNEKTLRPVLQKLASDRELFVREEAIQRLQRNDRDSSTASLAANTRLPPEVLNEALAAYIKTFPNRERLTDHIAKRHLAANADEITAALDATIKTAEDYLYGYPNGVPPWTDSLTKEFRGHMQKAHPWLDSHGFDTIKSFSEWLCWHDGLHGKSDREFYNELGAEDAARPCKSSGCSRGSVKFSVFCRVHHFESVMRRACPFDD